MTRWILLIAMALMLPICVLTAIAQQPEPATLKSADKLYADKNYAQAAVAYGQLIEPYPEHASRRQMLCYLRLRNFDAAIKNAQDNADRLKGKPQEALARQQLGNLYMLIPHWGTRAGGKFHRAKHMQGIRLQSQRHDKKLALEQLQLARDLFEKWDGQTNLKGWREKRIKNLFDLASAVAAYGIFENQPHFWHWYWAQRDDTLANTAGEADFDENQNYRQYHNKRPIGLRVNDDDTPIFPKLPGAWNATLPDDEKALFLLSEIRTLDDTQDKKFINLSLYRQAMLARARFGMDRMNTYSNMVRENGKQPLKEQINAIHAWELADNQVIVLAGGRMRKVSLPHHWDIIGLLNQTQGDQLANALYAKSLYHQTRKQYGKALLGYDELLEQYKKSKWTSAATNHKSIINKPQVQASVQGMQLAGTFAQLNVSHRNANHLWFVARKFDLPGFLQALRHMNYDHKKTNAVNPWMLQQWDQLLSQGIHQQPHIRQLLTQFLDDQITQWDQAVTLGEDHRVAKATVPTPLDANGTYLVFALTRKPNDKLLMTGHKALNISNSRLVMLISDVAIVEKKTTQGNLYFITDARNGKPLNKAKISIMETWNIWNRKTKKSDYFKVFHDLTTDKNGLAQFAGKRNQGSQLHVMVQQDDRFATNDMDYWNPYRHNQSRQRAKIFCLTDRPVYRPGQTVKFKAWVRAWDNGQWITPPQHVLRFNIYDPRGNKVKTLTSTTDDFGGISDELQLGEEASLGAYRLQFNGNYQVSSGSRFRVEEYKKPEFEVTVKTSQQQIKLGQTLKADIKAKYYFGQPVTHGQVSYKVYRETYKHQQITPGQWDWLYGSGYGLSWYESPWFNWWGRGCIVAPNWWYGWYPYWNQPAVRELVTEGKGQLDSEGKFTLSINTANALKQHGDQDHRYVIKAEVRDESRRTISGSGSVIATRQAFFATVEPTRGYFRPGEQIDLKIICQNPDGSPVQTQGQLVISQVQWTGPHNQTINEVQLDRQVISTDNQGRATVQYRYENSGQLKFQFITPDSWGQQVEGFALVWVAGTNFTGKLHRFNDLELITDKRTYQPGQTAHVMINTKQANSYVLLATDASQGLLRKWQLVHVPGKSVIIDLPVEGKHRPNFFIEAVTVSNAHMHQQMAQICVPPTKSILNITVQTDKPTYQPGETATVNITAVDHKGKPAIAQIALSAFDQSLLYISKQTSGSMASFYHGQLNRHRLNSQTNLLRQFAYHGNLNEPSNIFYQLPDGWQGRWGPDISDWRIVDKLNLRDLGMDFRNEGEIRLGSRMPGAMAAPMMVQKSIGRSKNKMEMTDSSIASAEESKADQDAGGGSQTSSDKPVNMRENFADSALWISSLTTNAEGKATATFTVPDNLTTWQIGSWAMTKDTQVGQNTATATATKDLLVRLQTPRFMVQRDELLITANVHNYLDHAVTVMVNLEIPDELLVFMDRTATQQQVTLLASGQATINWQVKAMNQGLARIAVAAKSPNASDAMAMTIPVLVHGSMQQIAQTAIMQTDELDKTLTIELNLPQQIQPQQTELRVQFSPTLIGTMLDALPYLLDYPYGCTEQTVSRFVPALQVRKTLRDMGLSLK
ncbi:MAG: hypothetical protein JKX85_06945, partial [Phycisphaeraceae bacterium]|nr:hypothetical protein [Phycisphaeraceae bacterium]